MEGLLRAVLVKGERLMRSEEKPEYLRAVLDIDINSSCFHVPMAGYVQLCTNAQHGWPL